MPFVRTGDELLTPCDAGLLLGVSAARIRQLIRSGAVVVAHRTVRGNSLLTRQMVETLAAQRNAKRVGRE
jgi:hypothetical protein